MKYILSALVVSLSIITSAEACMGPMLEVRSFLPRLPKDLSAVEYAAKVEVIEDNAQGKAYVKILKTYKGEPLNKPLKVLYPMHSCAPRSGYLKGGGIYFIAGKIDVWHTFTGEWRGMHAGDAQFAEEEYMSNE